MSWFRKNTAPAATTIPPVAAEPNDPYAQPRYNRDGGYNRSDEYSSGRDAYRDRYARNNTVGDPYSRSGNTTVETDRNELFSGYNAEKSSGTRFYDGPPSGRIPAPGEETEDDVEGIKKQIRYVKQESANSARNALKLAREAEDSARNTLDRLGQQSERLANTERHLDVAKGHSTRANDMTDELNKLNRSIFVPVITFNKDAKRAAQAARIQSRYDEERDERERTMMDIRETQQRLGRVQGSGRYNEQDEEELLGGRGGGSSRRFKSEEQLQARKTQRSRYQFEANASDDEIEDDIDDNLDEISNITKSLHALGTAMGQELDAQNTRLDKITNKTDHLGIRLDTVTNRQKRVK